MKNFQFSWRQGLDTSFDFDYLGLFFILDLAFCNGAFNGIKQFFSVKGLERKSIAPAFIAFTLIGISPCPVIKTIGIVSLLAAITS